MHSKKFIIMIFLISLIVFTGSSVFGDVTYSTNFSFSDLSFSTISGFDLVSLNGCDFMREVGKPKIPLKVISLVIPANMEVTGITVNSCDSMEIPGTYYIFPAQIPARLDGSPPPPFVLPDSFTYNSAQSYPGIFTETLRSGYFAGIKVVRIVLFPVQYIPVTQKLWIYTQVTLTLQLEFSIDNYLTLNKSTEMIWGRYINCAKSLVENQEQVETFATMPEILPRFSPPYTCVIITSS